MDRKTANALMSLLGALTLPALYLGTSYHNYRTERLANDPWYRTEDELEQMYQNQLKKLKSAPGAAPHYNVSEFEQQMRRPLI